MRKCPYCAEQIKEEAKKCRYCGSWLPEILTPEQKAEREAQRVQRAKEAKAQKVEQEARSAEGKEAYERRRKEAFFNHMMLTAVGAIIFGIIAGVLVFSGEKRSFDTSAVLAGIIIILIAASFGAFIGFVIGVINNSLNPLH